MNRLAHHRLHPNAPYLERGVLARLQQANWEEQRAFVAANSPLYQELWRGRPPPSSLADLPELPFSDKALCRRSQQRHPPYGDYLAARPDQIQRMHRTSGTSGQAMNLALSAADCEMTEIVGGRCQTAAGLDASHTVVHCLNYQMWMGGVTDHLTLERTGATVVPFGVGNSELLVRTILEVGVTAISCTPSYPAVLERTIAERFPGTEPHDLGLRLGLFGGEPGLDDPGFRQRIETVWGMSVRNANYGVSDVFCNFAAQCEHDTRLHFLAGDVLYPELIEPENGNPLPLEPGYQGELVLTHLARHCQPLVRFRTGDVIAVDETEPCRCGRTGMRFRVIGRSDDMVIVRGINLFPTQVAAVVTGFPSLSGQYRIVLRGGPPYDRLPLEVELAAAAHDADVDGADGGLDLAPRVEAAIKTALGVTAAVTVQPHGSFPVTEGKTSRVLRRP